MPKTSEAMNATCGTSIEDASTAIPKAQIGVHINTMFRAFSDPTRLRILHLLVSGEICVGDLVEILQLPQPAVSRHLAYLRKANLVQVRKSGLWAYYSLAPVQSSFQSKLYECLQECFCDVPELAEDCQRKLQVTQSGGCCQLESSSDA
ncbi:metalloregulator ArsR/SmtB family transcription factor [Stieleria sp. TO1_6]|uniref:ArsR/SmtB family transcription factor n=1 Tax=Stieleria tagensis TaxID=2956795 RepID=UPI00209B96A7|nr:metalloregulator ArsR/SmtB family transcription factor [Stieleria tagensis]MCO8124777.1 metalloregulator ArsR/SmtB family transcription factor [Stieleria tagensis]